MSTTIWQNPQQSKSEHSVKEAALHSMNSMSSAQIVSLFYSSQDAAAKEKALQSLTTAQIASLQNIQNKAAQAVASGHHPGVHHGSHPSVHHHHNSHGSAVMNHHNPHAHSVAAAAAAHHAASVAVHHAAASHVATAAAGLAALGIAPPPGSGYGNFWQPGLSDDIKPSVVNSQSNSSPFIANGTSAIPSANNNNNANNTINNVNNNNNNNSHHHLHHNHHHLNNHINNNLIQLGGDGRVISSHKLKMTEFTSFMDLGEGTERHLFVQIGGPHGHGHGTSSNGSNSPVGGSPAYSNPSEPILEDIDLRQISDKFPSNKDGLKELFDRGPSNAFFLVKFWADLAIPNEMMMSPGQFYGVNCHFESQENMVLTCSTKVCSFGKQVVEKIEVSPRFLSTLPILHFIGK